MNGFRESVFSLPLPHLHSFQATRIVSGTLDRFPHSHEVRPGRLQRAVMQTLLSTQKAQPETRDVAPLPQPNYELSAGLVDLGLEIQPPARTLTLPPPFMAKACRSTYKINHSWRNPAVHGGYGRTAGPPRPIQPSLASRRFSESSRHHYRLPSAPMRGTHQVPAAGNKILWQRAGEIV